MLRQALLQSQGVWDMSKTQVTNTWSHHTLGPTEDLNENNSGLGNSDPDEGLTLIVALDP